MSWMPSSRSTALSTSTMGSGGMLRDRISARWSDRMEPTAFLAASSTGVMPSSCSKISPLRPMVAFSATTAFSVRSSTCNETRCDKGGVCGGARG